MSTDMPARPDNLPARVVLEYTGPPAGWAPLVFPNDTVMSNCDLQVESWADEVLRTAAVYGHHAGRNFNGRVWYADGQFHEQVWVYHVPRLTLSADTLRDLMHAVNDEFGWE